MNDPQPTVVTVSASSLNTGRRASDPPLTAYADHAHVIVRVIQPLTIVFVRALRTFLQTLLGTLTAGMMGVMPATDFLHLLKVCASISVASGVVSLLQNTIELLGKFDQSHPTLTS
jgi:hypothetical protein